MNWSCRSKIFIELWWL